MNTYQRPYLIAELGVNFFDTAKIMGISPLEAAMIYIKEAKNANADAVKFQTYKADSIVSTRSPAYWDIRKEPTRTQHELFQKYDSFNRDHYAELKRCCDEAKIDFLSTPFDYESADYLDELMSAYKISSSDLSNLPFIRHIALKGKPIYLSVGAAYLSEIDEAVRTIRDVSDASLCLMHCVLSYPCLYEDANLSVIQTLRRIFPALAVGYSDHTLPDANMTVLTAASMNGATVIEKHFTLDKSLTGNDHYHAGDPADFRKAAENFRLLEVLHGSTEITVRGCEHTPRREARRSLVLTRNMQKGDVLTPEDMMAKRPGTGIAPRYAEIAAGRSLRHDLDKDTVLTWDMI